MKKIRSFLCLAIAIMLFMTSFPVSDFAIEANAVTNRIVMTADEFIECLKIASSRKNKYNNQYPYNLGYYNGSEISWDCWNLGKSIIWTNGAIVNNYTEGTYAKVDTSCGLGDWDGLTIVQQAPNFSNDFSNLVPGEWLYLNGHTGYYIGNGQVIECTGGSWGIYGITYSQIDGNGNRSRNGKAEGKWLYHGMVPWLDYTTNSEAKKLTKETYPSHCTIKVTENEKNIMSLPCSNKTNSKSDKVESAPKGSTYEAIGLILNTEDNLWYKVKAKNGKEGYIFAGNVSFVSTISSDITGSGISVPANHTHGKTYVLTGSVNSSYNELTNVSAYVYSGSNKITGGTASVNGKSYSLSRSAIDNQTEFNKLAVGQYTYKVTASYKSYYAKTDKTYGTKTGTVNVYSQAFNVVSGSVSPTVPQQPNTIIFPNNGGIYKIAYGGGNNMYLDFSCNSNNVQIYENCDGHSDPAFVISQYFKLTHIGDGWYTIINIGNGKCVDIENTNPASGTNIMQWDCYPNDGQLYRFYDAGNGYCYIKSKLGTYVDKKDGDTSNETNVWSYEFNGSVAQKWKLESHSHSYSSKVTQAASCTKTGVKTFTCNKCKHSYTETTDKLEHSYGDWITTKESTCTQVGSKQKTCWRCNDVQTQSISKTEHIFTSNIALQANCYESGNKILTCSCGKQINETIPRLEHADSNKDGYCDLCCINLVSQSKVKLSLAENTPDYVLVNVVVEKMSGSLSADLVIEYDGNAVLPTQIINGKLYDAGKAVAADNATEIGIIQLAIIVDENLDYNDTHILWQIRFDKNEFDSDINLLLSGDYSDALNVSGHTHKVFNVDEVKATCTKNGQTAGIRCEICHLNISGFEIIPKTGHNYVSKVTTVATCKMSGIITYTCTNDANHTYTENLGVNASNHVNTKNVAEIKATCTTKGLAAGVYCNDCQKYISGHKEIAINPSNHVNTKTVPATPATFDKVGYTEGIYCNDCKKYISGHKEISFVMNIGDLDGNGTITAADARIALRASVGLENLSNEKIACADVDKNGKITAADARMILRASVGLENLGKSKKS